MQKYIFVIILATLGLVGSQSGAPTIDELYGTDFDNACRKHSSKECQDFCASSEKGRVKLCKDVPIIESLTDTSAEKLIRKGTILSSETKYGQTTMFVTYEGKIYSCTLSSDGSITTKCERSSPR